MTPSEGRPAVDRSDRTRAGSCRVSYPSVESTSEHTDANRLPFLFPPLAETPAAPSLQAAQLQQKRARLGGEVTKKISHRLAPTFRHILPLPSRIQPAIKGEHKDAFPTQLHFKAPDISNGLKLVVNSRIRLQFFTSLSNYIRMNIRKNWKHLVRSLICDQTGKVRPDWRVDGRLSASVRLCHNCTANIIAVQQHTVAAQASTTLQTYASDPQQRENHPIIGWGESVSLPTVPAGDWKDSDVCMLAILWHFWHPLCCSKTGTVTLTMDQMKPPRVHFEQILILSCCQSENTQQEWNCPHSSKFQMRP